jgi:hypothetical protein
MTFLTVRDVERQNDLFQFPMCYERKTSYIWILVRLYYPLKRVSKFIKFTQTFPEKKPHQFLQWGPFTRFPESCLQFKCTKCGCALEIGYIILHDIMILIVATGTSARCSPDAMNENFTKVDPQLTRYFRRVYIKRLLYKWFKYICANYIEENPAYTGINRISITFSSWKHNSKRKFNRKNTF